MTLPAAAPLRSPPIAWPLLAAAAAALAFISMDTTIKYLAPRYDALQLTFFRFASGLAYCVAVWAWVRSPLPDAAAWRLHALRAALLLVSLTSYFQALKLLPLAQAVAIGYTAPIFISLLAVWLLRERPSRFIGLSLALGVAGAAVALWPQLQQQHTTQVLGLACGATSAVFFAFVMVLSRRQAQRDRLATILLIQSALPAAVLLPVVAADWQPVAASDWPWIALTGLLGTVGLLCITWAYRHMEASRAAPMEYTGFVWAGALGYAVFGEIPTGWTIASAALIVAGCLVLVRRR